MANTKQAPGAESSDGATQFDKQRAEELADQVGQVIGQYASRFGLKILQATARAREEAEDMWAEAQALRHQKP